MAMIPKVMHTPKGPDIPWDRDDPEVITSYHGDLQAIYRVFTDRGENNGGIGHICVWYRYPKMLEAWLARVGDQTDPQQDEKTIRVLQDEIIDSNDPRLMDVWVGAFSSGPEHPGWRDVQRSVFQRGSADILTWWLGHGCRLRDLYPQDQEAWLDAGYHPEMIRILVAGGYDPHCRWPQTGDVFGHICARRGDASGITMWAGMGGDIHAVNAHGDSIGDCAVDSASPRCLDRWIQAGGDIHQEGRRIIDRIAPKGVMGRSLPNRECMRMWIRAGGPVFVSSQTHEDDTRRADMALISIESVLHEPRMRVLWEGLHLRKDPHHTISPETVFAMCHQEGMAMAHHVMTGLQTPESIMTWAMMMEEASGSEKDRQC